MLICTDDDDDDVFRTICTATSYATRTFRRIQALVYVYAHQVSIEMPTSTALSVERGNPCVPKSSRVDANTHVTMHNAQSDYNTELMVHSTPNGSSNRVMIELCLLQYYQDLLSSSPILYYYYVTYR